MLRPSMVYSKCMEKVFVVFESEKYVGEHFLGIFRTKEGAEKFCESVDVYEGVELVIREEEVK